MFFCSNRTIGKRIHQILTNRIYQGFFSLWYLWTDMGNTCNKVNQNLRWFSMIIKKRIFIWWPNIKHFRCFRNFLSQFWSYMFYLFLYRGAFLQLRFKYSIFLMKWSNIYSFSTFELKKFFSPYFGVYESISANDSFMYYCIFAEDILFPLLCGRFLKYQLMQPLQNFQ